MSREQTTPDSSAWKRYHSLLLMLVILLAFWIRLPGIIAGSPFIYDEDEGHHFNRTVEMVKRGDFHPHYFHKPSLHFYLRIPAIAAAFLYEVKEGRVRSIKELRTRDPYGLAGYSFTASHPSVLKAARLVSLILDIGSVLLGCAIAWELCAVAWVVLFAGLLSALSPELVRYSTIVGVDVVMTFFCSLAIWLALRCHKRFSLSALAGVAFVAGLGVSSKYNALPIAILPLALCLARFSTNWKAYAIALLLPGASFLLASPYILSSLPLFLDELAYEVWHYAVAGHEGHTAEPGLKQLLFYARWFVTDGLGIGACFLMCFGALRAIWIPSLAQNTCISLLFPLLYTGLMISQRTNFERNMIVIVPVCAALAALGFGLLSRVIKKPLIILALMAATVAPLAKRCISQRFERLNQGESRFDLTEWLAQHSKDSIAVAGRLGMPAEWLAGKTITVFDPAASSAASLSQQGIKYAALQAPAPAAFCNNNCQIVHDIQGSDGPVRVPANPHIVVYSLGSEK